MDYEGVLEDNPISMNKEDKQESRRTKMTLEDEEGEETSTEFKKPQI